MKTSLRLHPHPLPAVQLLLTLALATLATPAISADADELSLEDLLNTTVTTASKFAQRVSEAPSSVTVIRGEEIRSHGWRNLGEALTSVRGFDINYSNDYQFLGVRGFSQPGDFNSRILLLIDGIPSNDGIYDQAMIGPEFPLDMNLIERIEVVPGPGSALYGGNAFLAVVNVITRQSDSVGRSVTLAAGSHGMVRSQASAGGKDETGRHWLISASAENSHGADLYFPQWDGVGGSDGWARDMDSERLRRVFMRYGSADWNLHLLYGKRQKEVAGGQYAADFDKPADIADTTTQIGLRWQRPLANGWTLEGNAYAGEYRYEGEYAYGGQFEADDAHSRWLGGSVQLTGKSGENQTWVVGVSIRDDFKRDQENIGGVIKGERTTTSLYAQDDIRFNEMFSLNLGGRYDHDTLGSNQFSPRGALLVNLPAATVLKLMSGMAFRPPNAYESDYAYPGTQLAGGALDPERVTTNEISLEQAIGSNGRWNAAVFRNDFQDLISVATDFNTGLQQIQNIGEAHTQGVEFGARYRFAGGVDVRGSVSWQQGEDAAGATLPNSPQRLAKLLATVPVGAYELGWETYYTGPRDDVFGATVGGQTVSHAALSGRFSRDLRWQMRVQNLFDRQLASVVGAEYSLGAAGNVPTIVANTDRQWQLNLTLDF